MNTQRLSLPFPVPLADCFNNAGKTRIKTDRYKAYQREAAQVLAYEQKAKPMAPPYHIEVSLRAPDNRARDGDNLLKCLFDTLVKCGILTDDSNREIKSFNVAWVDEGEPCVVQITSI